MESGFDHFEHLVFLMKGKYRITEKVLQEEIRIEKLGHRHRIMAKLRVYVDSGHVGVDNGNCKLL